jgi:membrane peptidoglycan carboxypeptidase
MDSQVQYAMQKVAYTGTAAGVAGMSDGRQIISKTGTTNTAQSAFFIGAIPQEALAVALFTDHQSGQANDQTLNGLGGVTQAFGGTWPAAIWHTYAQGMFIPLTPTQFPPPQFTGKPWKLAPNSLLTPKKKATHKHGNKGHNPNPGNGAGGFPSPTATCAPGQITVDCNPVTGNGTGTGGTGTGTGAGATPTPGIGGLNISTPTVTGSQAGAAAFGGIGGLPLTLLWARRRKRAVR